MSTKDGGKKSLATRLFDALRALGGRRGSSDAPEERSLRSRLSYERFREILALNDATLELIADLEDARAGRASFTPEAMGRRVRRAAMDVFLMVKDLNMLTGNKYPALFESLREVNAALENELAGRAEAPSATWILPLAGLRATDAALAGTKMANLGELRSALGLNVPDGFVVTTAAFDRFMSEGGLWERAERLETILETHGMRALTLACREVQAATLATEVPLEVAAAMRQAFATLEQGQAITVSVRSSAAGEDRAASHAGQYHTELHVASQALLDAYRAVLASAFSPNGVFYRRAHGLSLGEARMAVGCMRMLEPRCAGVLFSRAFDEPTADRVVISATGGLAARLVAGEQSADEILVTGEGATAGVTSWLSTTEIALLARTARRLEAHFGEPQDIEWAFDGGGQLFLLQARPLSVGSQRRDPPLELGADVTILAEKGLTACPGWGAGPVVQVAADRGLDEFPEGAVLVARQASPTFSRVMRRAAAIVTEVGSPTGHLAILAREFDVPAIVGLPGATDLLPAGRVVTVDASRARVYDGRLALPPRAEPARARPASSPAAESWKHLAELVSPLHLTDPASPDFSPSGCRSLHDLTRFVHEKLFEVMFHFGQVAAGGRSETVTLEAHLPLTIVFYDVGGGLHPRTRGRGLATPADVRSAPAQAYLEGLLDQRIKWDQPKAVSARGFLSVVGEGLAGPPAEAQDLGRTSYAVVSDRYLNLSTRAGYHFSTLDAFCGPNLNENYLHFRFERGGASGERRARRLRFLAAVLSQLRFEVRVREDADALVARLEKLDRESLRARLTELGRLSLVARQLDMLMETEESPEFFAKAFLAGDFSVF